MRSTTGICGYVISRAGGPYREKRCSGLECTVVARGVYSSHRAKLFSIRTDEGRGITVYRVVIKSWSTNACIELLTQIKIGVHHLLATKVKCAVATLNFGQIADRPEVLWAYNFCFFFLYIDTSLWYSLTLESSVLGTVPHGRLGSIPVFWCGFGGRGGILTSLYGRDLPSWSHARPLRLSGHWYRCGCGRRTVFLSLRNELVSSQDNVML